MADQTLVRCVLLRGYKKFGSFGDDSCLFLRMFAQCFACRLCSCVVVRSCFWKTFDKFHVMPALSLEDVFSRFSAGFRNEKNRSSTLQFQSSFLFGPSLAARERTDFFLGGPPSVGGADFYGVVTVTGPCRFVLRRRLQCALGVACFSVVSRCCGFLEYVFALREGAVVICECAHCWRDRPIPSRAAGSTSSTSRGGEKTILHACGKGFREDL